MFSSSLSADDWKSVGPQFPSAVIQIFTPKIIEQTFIEYIVLSDAFSFHDTIPTSLGRFGKIFTGDMALELVRYCQDMATRFYGPTRKQLCKCGFNLLTSMVSDTDWVMQRNFPAKTGWETGKRHGLSFHTQNNAAWAESLDMIECSIKIVWEFKAVLRRKAERTTWTVQYE
jgi:hypothetical protein